MKRSNRRAAMAGLAMAVCLPLAACGTTVKGATEKLTALAGGRGVVSATGGAAPGVAGSARPGLTGTSSGTSSLPGGTTLTGPTGTAPVTGSSGAPNPSASGPGVATGGAVRGITDTTITVGITWTNIAALLQVYAPQQNTSGDHSENQIDQVIVDWMNKHGGIAGRKIIPVYDEFPTQSQGTSSGRAQEEQSQCDYYTLDHHAFAALPEITDEGVFETCAAQRNLVTITNINSDQDVDAERFRQIGGVWYRPNWITGERRERVVVSQLQRRGFFGAGAKIGVLIYNQPTSQRTYQDALLPALKAAGATPVATATYQLADPMNSIVLQFRTQGVNRVIWGGCPCAGLDQADFMTAAESQGYKPMYGISTDLLPKEIVGVGAPADQLANTVAFGWNPSQDIGDTGTGNAAEKQCVGIAKAAGMSTPDDVGAALSTCDGLFFLKRGLDTAKSLSPAGFRAAIESLGSSLTLPGAFATRFGSGRHDGAAAVRDLYYGSGCNCFTYRGPAHDVG